MIVLMKDIISILLFLTFFTILGLGITSTHTLKRNFLLVPIFGYAALIGLAYFISGNFKLSGAESTAYAIIILLFVFLFRSKKLIHAIKYIFKNGEFKFFCIIILISMISIMMPAIWIGFRYFYGYINFDFFYNSQDAWILSFKNINEYFITNNKIIPLDWSANFSGRIGIGILSSFFVRFGNLDPLHLNSLLLNSIVILFSFSISVFCKEFFNFNRKITCVSVFLTITSASYVQAYCYYLLGQISATPIFILYCVYLKKLFEYKITQENSKVLIQAIILGFLLNILFIMYAILSVFALATTVLCFFFVFCRTFTSKQRIWSTLLFIIFFALILFVLTRISILGESINIFNSWFKLSSRVAKNAVETDQFIVFSEYLSESVLSLFLGLINYPSVNSIFKYFPYGGMRTISIFCVGIIGFTTTLYVIKTYYKSKLNFHIAQMIFISLFFIVFILGIFFFFNQSGYGLFKLQTWFVPLLMPLYVYFLIHPLRSKLRFFYKTIVVFIIILNLISSFFYLREFLVPKHKQNFLNAKSITNNKNIIDVAEKLKSISITEASLFFENGMQTGWIGNLLREVKLKHVFPNKHVLLEKDFAPSTCQTVEAKNWKIIEPMIIINPKLNSDIMQSPEGGKVIYENANFTIVNPTDLKTFIFLGSGSYPVEYYNSPSDFFPKKFRWIEKGLEILIYSKKSDVKNILIEVTPGFVECKKPSRTIIVKTDKKEHQFSINSKKTITVQNVNLHSGLNCLTIESPDIVSRLKKKNALFRPLLSIDPRLNNFAVSYIGFENKGVK